MSVKPGRGSRDFNTHEKVTRPRKKHLVDKPWSFLTDEKAINDRIFAAEQRGLIDMFPTFQGHSASSRGIYWFQYCFVKPHGRTTKQI